MGIRESLLNTITSVGNGDFVRIVTSAGASSKATLQNVIKSFETGLGAKSSLTTSDYIRVVGSDNNLYKQSVSGVADMLNNNMPIPQFSASGFADLETKLSSFSGRYIASVTGSDGATTGLNTWTVIGFKNSTGSDYAYGFQYAFSFDDAPYVRYRRNSATWGAWQKMPNRAEVDALNSKTTRYAKTITVSNSKINSAVAFAEQIGSLVVVVFYFTATSAISRGETLYTIDLSTNFARNFFDRKILLATGTKEVRADTAIAADEVVSGTYIGTVL